MKTASLIGDAALLVRPYVALVYPKHAQRHSMEFQLRKSIVQDGSIGLGAYAFSEVVRRQKTNRERRAPVSEVDTIQPCRFQ